jgi:hypothetical protein
MDTMKKLILFAAALAFLGCGSTYQFGREQGQLAPDAVAAKFSNDRFARMSLWSDQTYYGRVNRVTDSTLEFSRASESTPMTVPTDQIRSISIEGSRLMPTVLGSILGAACGALLGSAVKNENSMFFDMGNEQTFAIAAGVVLGAVAGGVLGHGIPPKTHLIFASSDHAYVAHSIQEMEQLSDQVVSITIQSLSEDGYTVSFFAGSKTIKLPGTRVKVEPVGDGFRLTATRGVFREGGLDVY